MTTDTKSVDIEDHWLPVVEIATDMNDVGRFPRWDEWLEVTETVKDGIEAALPEEARR